MIRNPHGYRAPIYYIGVDFGQVRDATAIAVVESEVVVGRERDKVTGMFPLSERLVVRQLERMRLGTEYIDVAKRVGQIGRAIKNLGALSGGTSVSIVCDGTGVGRPVIEMIRKEKHACQVVPVTITGGTSTGYGGGYWSVPKKDLIMGLVSLIQRRGLFYAGDLSAREIWMSELQGMRRTTLSGEPDDTVFAVALACWRARRGKVADGKEPLLMV